MGLDEMFPKPPAPKVGAPKGNKNARKRMPKTNRTIRCDDFEWNRWKLEANKADMPLADWIRKKCNRGLD